MTEKTYPSKLLLFGEHTVNLGSQALAMPLMLYKGAWKMNAHNAALQYRLKDWASYIQDLKNENKLFLNIDNQRFITDLERGLYFDADVPQGYGVGSSGVLCAALYDVYGIDKPTNPYLALAELKRGFAQLESFFHGTSSGIDPLVCYVQQAVLIVAKTMLTTVTMPMYIGAENGIFLLDTGISRDAATLIERFLETANNADFKDLCTTQLVPKNNIAIAAFLEGHWPNLMRSVADISQFQYEHLSMLIPESFMNLWQKTLLHPNLKLKICGAGGGGFILVFTDKKSILKTFFEGYELMEVVI